MFKEWRYRRALARIDRQRSEFLDPTRRYSDRWLRNVLIIGIALTIVGVYVARAYGAELASTTDTNAGLVDEHPYLFAGPCVRSPCQIQRSLSVNAIGQTQRIVLSVSLQQGPFTEENPSFESMSLWHAGREVSLEPLTPSALDGGALTITFDDSAASERPALGFQTSGTFRPYEPLAAFVGTPASGSWELIVMEYHEGTGYTRYLGATLDVWAEPLLPVVTVPEPSAWAMLLVGLGACLRRGSKL